MKRLLLSLAFAGSVQIASAQLRCLESDAAIEVRNGGALVLRYSGGGPEARMPRNPWCDKELLGKGAYVRPAGAAEIRPGYPR